MKLHITLMPWEFDLIEQHIDCDSWINPIEDEYVFTNPTVTFRLHLAFRGFEGYLEE